MPTPMRTATGRKLLVCTCRAAHARREDVWRRDEGNEEEGSSGWEEEEDEAADEDGLPAAHSSDEDDDDDDEDESGGSDGGEDPGRLPGRGGAAAGVDAGGAPRGRRGEPAEDDAELARRLQEQEDREHYRRLMELAGGAFSCPRACRLHAA